MQIWATTSANHMSDVVLGGKDKQEHIIREGIYLDEGEYIYSSMTYANDYTVMCPTEQLYYNKIIVLYRGKKISKPSSASRFISRYWK